MIGLGAFTDALSDTRTTKKRSRAIKPVAPPPPVVYKYISWSEENFEDVVSSVIAQRTIRYSLFTDMNDPFEVNPVTKGSIDPLAVQKYLNKKAIRKFLWNICTSKPITKPASLLSIPIIPWLAKRLYARIPFHQAKLDEIYQRTDGAKFDSSYRFLISCFSEDPLQPLMWAHYGREHTGIVVGYDTTHSYFKSADGRRRLGQVNYSDIRPWWGFSDHFAIDIGRRKSMHWSYEKEWRAAAEHPSSEERKVTEVVPKECITDIYLGVRMSKDAREKILALITAQLPGICVHELTLDDYHYKFNATPLAPSDNVSP